MYGRRERVFTQTDPTEIFRIKIVMPILPRPNSSYRNNPCDRPYVRLCSDGLTPTKGNKVWVYSRDLWNQRVFDILQVLITVQLVVTFLTSQSLILSATTTKGVRVLYMTSSVWNQNTIVLFLYLIDTEMFKSSEIFQNRFHFSAISEKCKNVVSEKEISAPFLSRWNPSSKRLTQIWYEQIIGPLNQGQVAHPF